MTDPTGKWTSDKVWESDPECTKESNVDKTWIGTWRPDGSGGWHTKEIVETSDNHPARYSLVHQIGELNKENEKLSARIAELEAALKRLHDATSGIDKIYTLTDDEEAYWSRELRAARAALGKKD